MRRTLLLSSSLALFFALPSCASTSETSPPASTPDAASVKPRPEVSGLGSLAPSEPPTPLPVEADDIVIGSPLAQVTLIAFLDVECGFCAQGFATLEELRQKYSEAELRIVIKHLPLDFHPQALPAAVAAQAVRLASDSKTAFSYLKLLFRNRSELGYSELAAWSAELGIEREIYNEFVADELTVKRIATDVHLARRHGIDGTPAFFINGRRLTGAQPRELFESAIEEEKKQIPANLTEAAWQKRYAERVRTNTQNSLAQALIEQDPLIYKVPVDGSPVEGNEDAAVTIVLFTDFECPYCKRAEATLAELRRLYSAEQVRWVFKHKPLPFHAKAIPASWLTAAISERAGSAHFFRAGREIFEGAPDLGEDRLTEIGLAHGLTREEIHLALRGKNQKAVERVRRDTELADDVGASGTPLFFINGRRLTGARPLAQFRAIIDHELEDAKKTLANGISRAALYEHLQREGVQPYAPQPIEHALTEKGQPSRGPLAAPVVIHIFSDFECPFCKRSEQVLQELEARYKNKLRFVWHDLPLPFHDHALPAARAAREAFVQRGNTGFWAMHEQLFALDGGTVELEREALLGYARKQGLQMSKFEAAIDGETHDAAIAQDQRLAHTLNFRGTPAFVVGRYVITGARPIEHFERVVQLELAHQSAK